MTVSDKERQRAFDYCNKYLPGAWQKATLDQLDVHPVSGGMTNQLYRCQLDRRLPLNGGEARQVLLRIYGPSKGDVRSEIEIFNQLAAAGLGPRLYATFDGGRFEEYLPSSALKWNEMTDNAIAQVIAHKIAAIHMLDVGSLDKKPNWLIDKFRYFENFINDIDKSSMRFSDFIPESSRKKARELVDINFDTEITFLETLFNQTQSHPQVFSHNDLHQNNIILMQNQSPNLEDRIVLIDFEYASYNYRTFDAANHLNEWCFDYDHGQYPHFYFDLGRFPSIETQKLFLSNYIDGVDQGQLAEKIENLNGSRCLSKRESVEILFNEMQACLMASNLLWAMWAIKSALTSKIRFGYWDMARSKWDCYLLTKRQFEQNSSGRNPDLRNKIGDVIKIGPSKI